MKLNLFLAFISMFVLASCSKSSTGLQTGEVDSTLTPLPVTNKLLVKAITTSALTGQVVGVDTFTYDNQKRMIRFNTTSGSGVYSFGSEYIFTYSGTQIQPEGYTRNYTGMGGSNSPIISNFLLFYDINNNLIKDSAINSNLLISSVNRTNYFSYHDKWVIKNSINPVLSGIPNTLDSTGIDVSGNDSIYTRGDVDASNHYTLKFMSKSSYGKILNPLYFQNFKWHSQIVYGLIASKYLITSSTYYGYSNSPYIQYNTYVSTTDSNGLFEKGTAYINGAAEYIVNYQYQ